MYQAIEAISTAGIIRPLEPVQFEENEHLVILRIPKTWASESVSPSPIPNWKSFVGSLKTSPNLNGDPLFIQQEVRREWD